MTEIARRVDERAARTDRTIRRLALFLAFAILTLAGVTLGYVVSLAHDTRRTAEATEQTARGLRDEAAKRERDAQADREAIDRQIAALRRDLGLRPAPTYRRPAASSAPSPAPAPRVAPRATPRPAPKRSTTPARPAPRPAPAPAPRPPARPPDRPPAQPPAPPAPPAPQPPADDPRICILIICI